MLLNLSNVLTCEGRVEHESVSIEMECFESKMGAFPIVEKGMLDLTLSNISSGKARVMGQISVTVKAACDRCLEEVLIPLSISFDEVVFAPDHEESHEADTEAFMAGYQLDAETLIYHEILENWPAKILCREDCKGVCTVCGRNLNKGECGCDRFVPDPRMAVIKDIFERNKEV